jgi:hypothetical protein
VGKFTASPTEPSSEISTDGDAWFDVNTGLTYVFYDGIFIQAAGGNIGATGATGPQGTLAMSTSWWLGA